jgi:hypothetical protein
MTSLPTIILSIFLIGLAVFISPWILKWVFWYDFLEDRWRFLIYVIQTIFVSMAILSLILRRYINRLYARAIPTRRELAITLFAVLITFLGILFVLEVAMRIVGIPFGGPTKTPSENTLAQFDAELGWSYIPNSSVTQTFGTAKREVTFHFDSIGSRVRQPGIERDPSAPSVLILGGSVPMGHALPYEEAFVGQLESSSEFPFQVVNLACQAYGTDQSLLILKRHFHKFNVIAVIHAYTEAEIFRNANYDRRELLPWMNFLGTKPLFSLDSKGRPSLKRLPARYENYTYSRLWAYFKIQLRRRGPRPSPRLTRALIGEMKDYVESNGAKFLLLRWVGLPNINVYPFDGMDINVIDTSNNPPVGWFKWRIPGDGHLDFRAHSHVAHLIVQEFKRLKLLP